VILLFEVALALVLPDSPGCDMAGGDMCHTAVGCQCGVNEYIVNEMYLNRTVVWAAKYGDLRSTETKNPLFPN
jgi:hypothetical protein